MDTMKAVRIHEYGGSEVLTYEDAPRPQPASDEVLIRVRAAGVNPADWKIRQGYLKLPTFSLPLTLGYDVAGEIASVGNSVTNLKVGDAIYAMLDMQKLGGDAEYVTTKAALVVPKPTSLDYTTAAAVPSVALTAWQALFDWAELKAGQKILIHGASGGVGGFALQFAKVRGASAIATASKANVDYVKGLGADTAIDYTSQSFAEVVKDVDVVLDTIGGETQQRSWTVLRQGGVLVSTVGIQGTEPPQGVKGIPVFVHPDPAQLLEIAQLIDSGKVKVTVRQTFPLAQAADAFSAVESGHNRGKIVLQVG
jgi:NADPH:quinone reductase-like Zn-dependent oxidoreductase